MTPHHHSDWKRWQRKLQEEMKLAGAGGSGSATGADIADALWMAANTKKCPRCSTAIEKDEGCNHMSCRKCRHEFCWICMQVGALVASWNKLRVYIFTLDVHAYTSLYSINASFY